MSGRLDGKVALITGTGDGIARTTALRFAAEGARIIGCDISAAKAEETVRLVREAGGQMESLHPIDLSAESQVNSVMKFAAEKYGGIDILVHYAMRSCYGLPEQVKVEDFRASLDGVVTMTFLVTKHAIPYMRSRGGGSMVIIGSISGADRGSGFAGNLSHIYPYAVSKGAVIRMGIALANYLGPDHIRVNIVSPGPVLTPAAAPLYGAEDSIPRRILNSQTLLGRVAVPLDVANAALFFASDEAAYVTGSNMYVDGGYCASGGQGTSLTDDAQVFAQMLDGSLSVDDAWSAPSRPKA